MKYRAESENEAEEVDLEKGEWEENDDDEDGEDRPVPDDDEEDTFDRPYGELLAEKVNIPSCRACQILSIRGDLQCFECMNKNKQQLRRQKRMGLILIDLQWKDFFTNDVRAPWRTDG